MCPDTLSELHTYTPSLVRFVHTYIYICPLVNLSGLDSLPIIIITYDLDIIMCVVYTGVNHKKYGIAMFRGLQL